MADLDTLAVRFEEHRAHLHTVAYRILGSASDADDAVQEAWLRLSRSDVSGVRNLRAWLTTVTGRVALNMLQAHQAHQARQARQPRREDAGAGAPEPAGPEDEALLGDSVGAALQVLLDTLEPRERLAFVLHDLFAVPFDEIAPVVGTSGAAARQLASRARRRVRAAPQPVADTLKARQDRQREVVAAFFAAAREARFEALLELLDPDVVMRADEAAARMGAAGETAGADAVARWLSGRAQAAVLADVAGEPGAVWATGGQVRVAFGFTVGGFPVGGFPVGEEVRIVRIDLIGDPAVLAELDIDVAVKPGGRGS
jgi:RNA polymerase sigma-70 factor (ECF subfamily)